MSIVAQVRAIVEKAARLIPGAEVICPLPVWDNKGRSIGVKIKAPKMMGPQECIISGEFVLSEAELRDPRCITRKAGVAVQGMLHEVQVKIVPKERRKVA